MRSTRRCSWAVVGRFNAICRLVASSLVVTMWREMRMTAGDEGATGPVRELVLAVDAGYGRQARGG